MRLGIAAALSHSTAREWAERHVKAGLSAAVFPVPCTESRRKILDYKKAAEDSGLLIAELGAWCNLLDKDEKKAAENLDYTRRAMAVAEEVGAKCVVNISGSLSDTAWDGGDKRNYEEETFEKVAAIVKKIVAEADRSVFTLEPMPWLIPYDADSYLKILHRVNDRRFAVHMDAVNMINSAEKYFFQKEFLRDIFDKLGNKIVSAHLKDVKLADRLTLCLEERAPFHGDFETLFYLRALESIDREMPVIIEHLDSEEAYLHTVKKVREALSDAEGVKIL